MRVVPVVLMLSFLIACGGEEPEEKGSAPRLRPAGSPVTVRPRTGGGGGGGGGGASRGIVEKEPLLLELILSRLSFERGEAIPVVLRLRNTGEKPVRIFDPARGLTADLEFVLRTPDARKLEIRQKREIPEASVREEDLVTLGPGARIDVSLDLSPMIRSSADDRMGEYRVEAVFSGGYHGKHLTMDLWNRTGAKRLKSRPVVFRITWPARLTSLGITPELDAEVRALLLKVGRDGTLTRGAMQKLAGLGDRIRPLLVELLIHASSRRRDLQLVGWNAFRLLLEAGTEALAALGPPTGDEPVARRMLRRRLTAAALEAEGKDPPPADAVIRDLLVDAGRRAGVTVRLSRIGTKGSVGDTLEVRGDGRVRFTRGKEGSPEVKVGALSGEQTEALFGVLVKERIWLHEPVRTSGQSGELLYHLEVSVAAEGGGTEPRNVLALQVRETEAETLNRSFSRILGAVQAAKGVLGR